MLEGTDLYSAYQPLSSMTSYENSYPEPKQESEPEQPLPPKKQNIQQQQQQSQSIQQIQQPMYDASTFNKQYDQEQRIMQALQEIRKKKDEPSSSSSSQTSYIDKLMSKKKELGRLLQFSLIIVLGLSLHYVIDYYLQKYIADSDLSFERQLFLRLLYPFSILFILWNLKVFIK